MGLFDRDYFYRRANPGWGQSPHDQQPMRPMGAVTPIVKWLLAINIAVFVLSSMLAKAQVPFFTQQVLGTIEYPSRFEMIFGLLPAYFVGKFMVWQLITYQFVHGNLMHILFNMFTLFIFGPHVERRIGSRSFLRLYLLGGIFAGLVNLLAHLYGNEPTVGASGSLCAVMAVFGLMNPNAMMMLFIVFIPVFIRARTFVILYAAWTVFQAFVARDGIAHIAHLGGLVFGWMYVYNIWRVRRIIDGHRPMEAFAAPLTLRNPFRALWQRLGRLMRRVRTPRMYRGQPYEDAVSAAPPPRGGDEHWDDRVDAILDKMSREGSDSLSREEWEVLRRYRRGG